MKILDIITEMTLRSYDTIGDFSDDQKKPGPFNAVDRKLVTHPVAISKAYDFFRNSPFNYRIFMSNLRGLRKHRESGAQDEATIRSWFGEDADKILMGHQSAITVIYMGNYGEARVPLTPWVMAHRIGHAIAASRRAVMKGQFGEYSHNYDPMNAAFETMFRFANTVLERVYGKSPDLFRQLRSYSSTYRYPLNMYSALFNMLGVQRSSRENLIKRPHEFAYEMFAQYIKDGHITLNPPQSYKGYGRQAWGKHSEHLFRKLNDTPLLQEMTQRFAFDMEKVFERILRDAVGKIYVM